MSKTYYKVVTQDLKSAIVNPRFNNYDFYNDFCVQYKVGEWIKPNMEHSKLMVFDSFDNAKRFYDIENNYNTRLCIYECNGKNPSRQGLCILVGRIRHMYDELLKIKKAKKKVIEFYNSFSFTPPGTIFCSAVKLVKKVY